jgi:hypothetical protein
MPAFGPLRIHGARYAETAASAHKNQFNGARKLRAYIRGIAGDRPSRGSHIGGSLDMKKLSFLCVALCVSLSTTAAFARGGGMGSHSMSMMGGGAFGTSAAAPGTNSLGTALPSSGTGYGPMKGPLLGTSPAIDREEAKVDKMIDGICRGC